MRGEEGKGRERGRGRERERIHVWWPFQLEELHLPLGQKMCILLFV